ncbi:MAG TPA: DUF6188 family protein [Mycobacterium sp.]|nr:DUF6188 family protein [Mycobacterium sp.]
MRLAIENSAVTRICFDHALTILTSSGYELRIETRSTVEVAGKGSIAFEPDSPKQVAMYLVGLIGIEISEAVVADSGLLKLRFETDTELITEPHGAYEAWTMSGPGGESIVCMPGGELAIWKGQSPNGD